MRTGALQMKELATLYFPNSTCRSATTQLRRWITYNKALSQALDETGYTRGQRYFTPRQVGLVFKYLGEP